MIVTLVKGFCQTFLRSAFSGTPWNLREPTASLQIRRIQCMHLSHHLVKFISQTNCTKPIQGV